MVKLNKLWKSKHNWLLGVNLTAYARGALALPLDYNDIDLPAKSKVIVIWHAVVI